MNIKNLKISVSKTNYYKIHIVPFNFSFYYNILYDILDIELLIRTELNGFSLVLFTCNVIKMFKHVAYESTLLISN